MPLNYNKAAERNRERERKNKRREEIRALRMMGDGEKAIVRERESDRVRKRERREIISRQTDG